MLFDMRCQTQQYPTKQASLSYKKSNLGGPIDRSALADNPLVVHLALVDNLLVVVGALAVVVVVVVVLVVVGGGGGVVIC